jgi:transposase
LLPPVHAGRRSRPSSPSTATWSPTRSQHLSEVFDNGNPVLEDAERHIRDLRAKVGELTMERDFLAGALGRGGLPSAKR